MVIICKCSEDISLEYFVLQYGNPMRTRLGDIVGIAGDKKRVWRSPCKNLTLHK